MREVGRYLVLEHLADGGMASVHVGALRGESGGHRLVAIKAMHPQLARRPEFRSMFLDEARTVARVRHPQVVATLDVLTDGDDVFLVMDYVNGPALSTVLRHVNAGAVPLAIASRLLVDVLRGLQAAHDAVDDGGTSLGIVHRDVSPHNVLVSDEGRALIMDFGIAMASDRSYVTESGEVKGKIAYMPPEQAQAQRVDRRADVYAAASTLFEVLVGEPPFGRGTMAETLVRLLFDPPPSVCARRPDVPASVDALLACALSKAPDERFGSAGAFADALTATVPPASAAEVTAWLQQTMQPYFAERAALVERATRACATEARRVRPALSSSPTLAGVTPTTPPRRAVGWRWAALALVAAAAVAAGGLTWSTGTASASRGSVAGRAQAQDELPAPRKTAAPAPVVASGTARGDARKSAEPASTGTTIAAPARSLATSAPPKCCIQVGATWERYSLRPDCVDNCPAGAR